MLHRKNGTPSTGRSVWVTSGRWGPLGSHAPAEQRARCAEQTGAEEQKQAWLPKLASVKRKKVLQPQILNGLVMTAGARQDWAGAQKHAETWLKLEPENTTAMQQLAQEVKERGRARLLAELTTSH